MAPARPAGPAVPSSPWDPSGPGAPGIPISPSLPGNPSAPRSPCKPGNPWRPIQIQTNIAEQILFRIKFFSKLTVCNLTGLAHESHISQESFLCSWSRNKSSAFTFHALQKNISRSLKPELSLYSNSYNIIDF